MDEVLDANPLVNQILGNIGTRYASEQYDIVFLDCLIE